MVSLATFFNLKLTIPHILRIVYAGFSLLKESQLSIELTNKVVEFVFQEILPSNPCTVVHTYFNSWWQSSTCPANPESAMMTWANQHLCIQKHYLTRLQYSIPFNVGADSQIPLPDNLPQSIANLCLQLSPATPTCNQNFVLVMVCADELQRLCREMLQNPPMLDADSDWSSLAAINTPPNPELATTLESPDPNLAWEHFQTSALASFIDLDPDATWGNFYMINGLMTPSLKQALPSLHSLQALDPNAAWKNFILSPTANSVGDLNSTLDANAAWQLFNNKDPAKQSSYTNPVST